MEQFPSNSNRPSRPRERDEPKKVERIVTSDVVRRKTPLGRRMSKNLIGGDAQSVWSYVFGDILIPAFRDTVADAVSGGVERMVFGDSGVGSRGRGRGRSSGSHVPYNSYSSPAGRSVRGGEPRRELSRHARANHSFEEIILRSRAEAEEVLLQLDDMIDRYDSATVSNLYDLIGVSSNFADQKWGWTDLRGASVRRAREGYLIDLPRPEPLD